MAALCRIGRGLRRVGVSGYLLELDLIREHFARQGVEEALAAGKPFGNLLDELRETAPVRNRRA
jgi:hypothetical protein